MIVANLTELLRFQGARIKCTLSQQDEAPEPNAAVYFETSGYDSVHFYCNLWCIFDTIIIH
jgi:hypothetical protein